MTGFLGDVTYSLRTFKKKPGFVFAAVCALALGIGANATIFSLVNAVLLRGLPGVSSPGQLVSFDRNLRGDTYTNFSYPDYLDFRDRAKSFSGVAASIRSPLGMSSPGHEPERIVSEVVTGNYFSVLGVSSAAGRLLAPSDDAAPGQNPVIVLSYGLWARAFNADPAAVGSTIDINGRSFTIIGVASQAFNGSVLTRSADAWLPLSMQPQAIPRMTVGVLDNRRSHWIQVFGRLGPGAHLDQARAEIETIGAQQEAAYPDMNRGTTSIFAGLGIDPDQRTTFERFLGLLMAGVLFLLLIACANLASLMMVRADGRRREIAIRLAIGGSRRRIIRQLLTEGLMLSAAGAVVGLFLAPYASSFILTTEQSPYGLGAVNADTDWRVLFFTVAVTGLSALLFGLWPAIRSSKADLTADLKEGASGAGRRSSRGQKALVVFQVAASLVLLIGAGLVVRTMRKLLDYDKGFESKNVLLMSMDLIIHGYTPDRGRAFYDDLLRRTRETPGVASVSLARSVPPDEFAYLEHVFYPGQQPSAAEFQANYDLGLRVDGQNVGPDYFKTMQTPIVTGREFTEQDRQGSQGVVVISQSLAARLWPGQDPIGRRIVIPTGDNEFPPPYEVAGVARDVRSESLLSEPPLVVYHPLAQRYDGRVTMVVRTMGDPHAAAGAIRDQVRAIDPALPLFRITTMSDYVAASLWQQRMAEGVIGVFGIVALLLTAMGIYGVVSQFVSGRTHEIGIRMALGATGGSVFRMVALGGIGLSIAGAVLGIGAALVLTRRMSGLLFGVGAFDPATYAAATILLIAVAAVGCTIPARRATAVDPIEALRYE